jgi:hypothetical protein
MFSRWIVMHNASARRTLHCHKTRIPCGDQLVICALYIRKTSEETGLGCALTTSNSTHAPYTYVPHHLPCAPTKWTSPNPLPFNVASLRDRIQDSAHALYRMHRNELLVSLPLNVLVRK